MRKTHLIPLVAAVGLALAGTAQAATKTTTFNVTATVNANCFISAGNLSFGNFDINDVTDTTATSTINVRCSKDTPYTVLLSSGPGSFAAREMLNGSDKLIYNLHVGSGASDAVWGDGVGGTTATVNGTGNGVGVAQQNPHTVHGRILAANNLTAKPGAYSATITATVSY